MLMLLKNVLEWKYVFKKIKSNITFKDNPLYICQTSLYKCVNLGSGGRTATWDAQLTASRTAVTKMTGCVNMHIVPLAGWETSVSNVSLKWVNESDGSMDGSMEGWMDGWVNEWMNEWIDGIIDEWMD